MNRIICRTILLLCLSAIVALPIFAGEFTVFGPQDFTREAGKPATVTVAIPSPVAGPGFSLKIRNGNSDNNRIASGTVALNGSQVAGPSDFNQQVGAIDRTVTIHSANTLSVQLAGQPGSHLTVSLTGEDNDPPQLSITVPANGTVTEAETISVTGHVEDATPVTIHINGRAAVVTDSSFSVAGIPLVYGENQLIATATDLGGNTSSYSIAVTRKDTTPPQLVVTEPAVNSTTEGESIAVSGTVTDSSPVTVNVNGVAAAVAGTSFSAPEVPLAVGSNTLTVAATDSWGNATTASITVTRQPPSPKVEPQPQGSFGAQYEDLIPANATKITYNPKRFSLITGEVRNLQNDPIPDVTVSVNATSCILCHGLEYGSVKTDTNGRFTIPIEGGSTMTVVYQKPGLITSHRQVYVPWNGYAVAETIQMLPEDTAATTVIFDGNPDTIVTHRSTPMQDEFGARAATLVFSGDNRAYEVDANGSVIRELKTITTRATEFVTPESMPANLPPTSAYTYCNEFSVDGAERVRFNKPVIGWVDNFLGFDVGEIVPVGYYDRDRGVWVPSDNGRVVMLLDTDSDGGVDALDSDGDNFPNDLNGDGSFRDEVKGLEDSSSYRAGTTFWRFSVTHFTPWDCNWPFGPPPDATPPNPQGEPEVDQQADKEQPCDKSEINSFVEDRSRIFHEDMPIPGTDMTLHYASNRVKGYQTRISVPISGAVIPPSLQKIVVQVNVAGRSFYQTFPPLPNQRGEFVWDGQDGLGRPVVGAVSAQISIGYVYEAVYYAGSELFTQAFANAGGEVTGVRGRSEIITWRRTEKVVDIGRKGVGLLAMGWSFSAHHYLSPKMPDILFMGDGKTAITGGTIISTVAGKGGGNYNGDGGPAVQAMLNSPRDVAVDAEGNLYIADHGNVRVRKVDGNSIITTVAGIGIRGYSGDGGPAVQARLDGLSRITVDAAGNLYIPDNTNHRVRKVDTNGIITTVVGNGIRGYGGDGGPATQAALNWPSDVEVDSAGNLFVADLNNCRIRKVDTNGIITTVAGNGIRGYGGDGRPAVEAELNPYSLEVDFAGNLYIVELSNNRVRKVDASGIITTAVGTGTPGYGGDGGPAVQAELYKPSEVVVDAAGNLFIADPWNNRIRKVDGNGIITTVAGIGIIGYSGEGGPPGQAQLASPYGVAVDAAGNLYIADTSNSRIRKVAPLSAFAKSGNSAGDIYFTEENGLGHNMSSTGLHKKTIDLDTGITLRTFGYDANSNLITITDQFGKVTTINRDANGVPISIVGPDGQTTQLTIDGSNHLTAVAYPGDGNYSFEYTPDGLMTAEIDPNGNRFEHVFDVGGRLTGVTDPELGHWKYARPEFANGDIRVQKTTGEGNVTTYIDRTDSTGAYTTAITNPSGGLTTVTRSADGLTETSSLSCGMNVVSKYNLDSEYKFKFVKEQTESTPTGKKRLTLRDKIYLDTNGDKIPDRITDKITINGKFTTLLQDVIQAKKEVTTPLGRKVTSFYNPANLLTTRLSIAGLQEVNYNYDSKGRVTSLVQGERQTAFTHSDNGYLASVTDPDQRTTTYDTDIMGRVTGISRPDGSSIGFDYDNNGNMTVLTNPSSVPHAFDYNGNDYKTGYQAPLSGSYRYSYDKDRRLVETLFPSGRQILNVYDKDRLAKVITPEGDITLNYLCATKLGSMSKGGETIGYAYDGKLVTSETLGGTLSQTLSYAYNTDFAVTSFTYAGGTVNYAYDNDGLLTGAGGFTITRNTGNGLPESVTSTGYSLARSFNGYGEVAGETTAMGGLNKYAYTLSHSPSGRITGKTETVNGETANLAYTYDDLGRLLTVSKDGALIEEYRYDGNGRRTYEMNAQRGIAGRAFAYSGEDHLLTAGDTTYQYDLDGFLTTKTDANGITSYEYSSRGELLRVDLPDSKIIEYVHDPQGRRIAKKANGVIAEKYQWQGMTRLLAIYSGSNNLLMRFQYADSRMPVAMTKGGTIYYLAYDQVGSLRAVTDATGNLVKRVDYDSFGNILTDSNPDFTVPFGFAGGLHDRDIKLVRFGFRDYDSETGRWAAKDPIGFAGGDVDVFGYCLQNPVNLVDPNGQIALWPIFKISSGVYAFVKAVGFVQEKYWEAKTLEALAEQEQMLREQYEDTDQSNLERIQFIEDALKRNTMDQTKLALKWGFELEQSYCGKATDRR